MGEEIRNKEIKEVKFKPQEYEDLLSAVGIAIKNAQEDSPQFKKALERLSKKLWRLNK